MLWQVIRKELRADEGLGCLPFHPFLPEMSRPEMWGETGKGSHSGAPEPAEPLTGLGGVWRMEIYKSAELRLSAKD